MKLNNKASDLLKFVKSLLGLNRKKTEKVVIDKKVEPKDEDIVQPEPIVNPINPPIPVDPPIVKPSAIKKKTKKK